jgi:predicted alpha/beta hydrolase family esterase
MKFWQSRASGHFHRKDSDNRQILYFSPMKSLPAHLVLLVLALCFACHANQKIYLVHGYGSSPLFMKSIEHYLKKNKLEIVNYGYPSLTEDLTVCGDSLYAAIRRSKADTVSFVTHSMGALVVRSMVNKIESDPGFPKINRIVMITPPNHGAEIADFFAWSRIWRYILGPNIQNLATDSNSLANHLPVPDRYEIGIIIGINKNKKGYNPFIKGNNDGYLTPKSALLGTEKEDFYISSGHSMIIHNKRVLKLVYQFIMNGKF